MPFDEPASFIPSGFWICADLGIARDDPCDHRLTNWRDEFAVMVVYG